MASTSRAPLSEQHRSLLPVADDASDVFAFGEVDRLRKLVAGWLLAYGAANTRRAYARDFAAWCSWLEERRLHPLSAQRGQVDAWARHCEAVEGLRPSTVARRLATLASFYRYCVDEGVIVSSPVANVRRPKTGEGHVELTPGLDRDELTKLLAVAHDPRDRAVAVLLTVMGLRVSEALALDLEGLQTVRGHRTVLVKGKGGREDRVPLPPIVVDAIERLAASEGRSAGPVFVGAYGERMSPQAVSRVLARLSRRAVLGRVVRPHMLRVSAITGALDAGASLRRVQDFARHVDPRTTRRYDRGRGALDDHAAYVVAAWLSPDANTSEAECLRGGAS